MRMFSMMLAVACLAAVARADVLVVDGLGVLPDHYATVQTAVDAAAPGDTVLIDQTLDTSAQSVVIDGKGFHLTVDTYNQSAELKKLTIRNLPAGQVMTVRGIDVLDPVKVAMVFEDNAGALRLFHVNGRGKAGVATTTPEATPRDGDTGATFSNCADVVLRTCGFSGGNGGTVDGPHEVRPSGGGVGAVINGSKVSSFFSHTYGGAGGDVEQQFNPHTGGSGGTGLVASGSQLFLYGQGPRGGFGGDGGGGDGGNGGAGASLSGPGQSYRHHSAPPYGGIAGQGGFGVDGTAGPAQQLPGVPLVNLAFSPGFANDSWVNSPVREGEPIELTVIGFQDEAFLLYGLVPGNQIFPEYQGGLSLSVPFSDLIYLGPVPLLGSHFPLGTVPELGPGFEAIEVHLQVVTRRVPEQNFKLASPESVLLLDAAY